MIMPPATKAGDVYNGITAIRYHHSDKGGNQYWLFRCRCGREWVCRAADVRSGHTTLCGQGKCHRAFLHGLSRPDSRYRKEYIALYHAILQCDDPNDEYYPEVGAKGIKVCDRWRRNFGNFLADVGACPKGKRFLQRINLTKDFKRGNVRWTDDLEHGCTYKNNRWVTLDDITLHLTEWSRVTGIKRGTLDRRLSHGWSPDEALTTPVGQPRGKYQCRWLQDRARLIELAQRNFRAKVKQPKRRRSG